MLITAAECANTLGIAADDALLVRLVSSTDAWIKKSMGRKFERAVTTEVVRGYGLNYVFLRESPIVALIEVRVDYWHGLFGDDTIVSDLTGFSFNTDPSLDDNRLWYVNMLAPLAIPSPSWGFPDAPRATQVTYEAGFDADIPEDLREKLIERVCAKWKQGPDEEMKQESQGDRAWTKFDTTDKRILAALRRYKR
jgi:hypothetical protein